MPNTDTGFDVRRFAFVKGGNSLGAKIKQMILDMLDFDGNLDGGCKLAAQELGLPEDPSKHVPILKGALKYYFISEKLVDLQEAYNAAGAEAKLKKKELIAKAQDEFRRLEDEWRFARGLRGHLAREARERMEEARNKVNKMFALRLNDNEALQAAGNALQYEKEKLSKEYENISLPAILGRPEAKFLRQIVKRQPPKDPDSFWVDSDGEEHAVLYREAAKPDAQTLAEYLEEMVTRQYPELSIEKLSAAGDWR